MNLNGLRSFVIEESKGVYRVWFTTDTRDGDTFVFLFEGLTSEEYHKLVDIFTSVVPFRAEIPKETGKLTYIPKAR